MAKRTRGSTEEVEGKRAKQRMELAESFGSVVSTPALSPLLLPSPVRELPGPAASTSRDEFDLLLPPPALPLPALRRSSTSSPDEAPAAPPSSEQMDLGNPSHTHIASEDTESEEDEDEEVEEEESGMAPSPPLRLTRLEELDLALSTIPFPNLRHYPPPPTSRLRTPSILSHHLLWASHALDAFLHTPNPDPTHPYTPAHLAHMTTRLNARLVTLAQSLGPPLGQCTPAMSARTALHTQRRLEGLQREAATTEVSYLRANDQLVEIYHRLRAHNLRHTTSPSLPLLHAQVRFAERSFLVELHRHRLAVLSVGLSRVYRAHLDVAEKALGRELLLLCGMVRAGDGDVLVHVPQELVERAVGVYDGAVERFRGVMRVTMDVAEGMMAAEERRGLGELEGPYLRMREAAMGMESVGRRWRSCEMRGQGEGEGGFSFGFGGDGDGEGERGRRRYREMEQGCPICTINMCGEDDE